MFGFHVLHWSTFCSVPCTLFILMLSPYELYLLWLQFMNIYLACKWHRVWLASLHICMGMRLHFLPLHMQCLVLSTHSFFTVHFYGHYTSFFCLSMNQTLWCFKKWVYAKGLVKKILQILVTICSNLEKKTQKTIQDSEKRTLKYV